MGRPKKAADDRLSEHVHFLTTVRTRETLATRSRACGVSEGEFLRRYIDGQPNVERHSAASDPAMIAALNSYAVALGKIGNNVNQLAAATHQGRDFARYWREIGAELEADLKASRKALSSVLDDFE